ncbi:UNVERIFIED_CONTAM: hypothetical protein NCL1_46193 [Trichonephila clavipes]
MVTVPNDVIEGTTDADMKPKKAVRKVIEGTSDYQATWIVEDENEGSEISDEESCNNSQMMSDNESEEIEETMDVTDSMSVTDDIKDDNYDDNLDMEEEKLIIVLTFMKRFENATPFTIRNLILTEVDCVSAEVPKNISCPENFLFTFLKLFLHFSFVKSE